MSFFDKAKAQAQQLAAKTQEGVKTGQEKYEASQAAKRADVLLRDLGAQVYLQQTGRPTADGPAQVARLTAELQQYEAEHGPIDPTPKAGAATPEAPAAATSPAPPAPPAAGAVPPPAYAPPPAPTAPAAPPAPPAPPQGGNFSLDDL